MSALGVTMGDLSAVLRRLTDGAALENAAISKSQGVAAALGGTARVVRDGANVAVEFTAPRLFEREYGSERDEGDAPLAAALRRANR